MNRSLCSVIIVTHDSELFLEKALRALEAQTLLPDQVLLVDSGSKDLDALYRICTSLPLQIIEGGKEIGFCKANNRGMESLLPNSRYVLFLNPDAFPFPDFIEKAVAYLSRAENTSCGALTGKTMGYDIVFNKPSGRYDTTGIFQSWYGKWYDRAQGSAVEEQVYDRFEDLPAICGALFFCRRAAIEQVLLNRREIFDERFYMYKEDIDLSLRLRKAGWRLTYHPEMLSYHCRGWSKNRQQVPRRFRLYSAKNELRLQIREKHCCGVIYSLAKYAAVKLLNL